VCQVDGHAAEPVFYMIGGKPIGAFMRIHPDKGDADNLNQPGLHFQPICRHRGCHDETDTEMLDFCATNAEQLSAELAALALAYESTPEVRAAQDAASVPLPAKVQVA
jgi:glutamate--cysteine ligase